MRPLGHAFHRLWHAGIVWTVGQRHLNQDQNAETHRSATKMFCLLGTWGQPQILLAACMTNGSSKASKPSKPSKPPNQWIYNHSYRDSIPTYPNLWGIAMVISCYLFYPLTTPTAPPSGLFGSSLRHRATMFDAAAESRPLVGSSQSSTSNWDGLIASCGDTGYIISTGWSNSAPVADHQ